MGKVGLAPKTGENYEAFVASVKDECEKRFGEIKWTETVTDNGYIMVIGKVRDEITIKISPHENMFIMGSVVIYSPRLCHEPSLQEMKLANALCKRAQRIWEETEAALEKGVVPEDVAKGFCQKMRELNPKGQYDELSVSTFLNARRTYGKQFEEVCGNFCTIWESNIKVLLDKESDDYVFKGGHGSLVRIAKIKQVMDEWALEQNQYFKRMEGAGRIFFAGEMGSGFEPFMKSMSQVEKNHQVLYNVFKRQYELLLLFVNDGVDNPNVDALIQEFFDNNAKVLAIAAKFPSKTDKK